MEPKISKRFSFVHVAKLRQMMMLTKGKTLKGCRVFPKDASFSLFSPEKMVLMAILKTIMTRMGRKMMKNERLGNKICPISCIEDFFCVYLQTNE